MEFQLDCGQLHGKCELNAWAPQTNASIVFRAGNAVALITAVAGDDKTDQDFFPLTVEYRERMAGGGRFVGAVGRRELRSTDAETLSSRLIDRGIRPLFPKAFMRDTVITVMAFSADENIDLATASVTALSLTLMCSDINWDGPVVGLRIARNDGAFIAFPTPEQRKNSDLDFVVTVGTTGILMVEGQSDEVSEDDLVHCLDFAVETAKPLLDAQIAFAQKYGKEKMPLPALPELGDIAKNTLAASEDAMKDAFATANKTQRNQKVSETLKQIADNVRNAAAENGEELSEKALKIALEHFERQCARELILSGRRFDGRSTTAIRQLKIEAGLLPSAHGSAFFSRGLTQSLSTVTLGNARDSLRWDDMLGTYDERFYLHYNFPPYSVGEARGQRTPGRREIGHGMLAQRALTAVIPKEEDFPYTIRVVSDILSSDGSSSMATVCAGCLALMDAGVPIKAPVTGIAMGLISEGEQKVILTDIVGDEDHLGDMDFKVCGTKKGVTALQMDLKIDGLTRETMLAALMQARQARLEILGRITAVLNAPRMKVKADRVAVIKVRKDAIGEIIGPGGANIRTLMQMTKTQIDIDDNGRVRIAAKNPDDLKKALATLENKSRVLRIGDKVNAAILSVRSPFLKLELMPGVEASLHYNDMPKSDQFVEDRYRSGDYITVKVIGTDEQGNIKITAIY